MSNVFYDIEINTVFKADENEPRHSEASVIELKDKSLLMAWQCHLKSPEGSNDTAPSNISVVNSYDGGKTWVNRRVLVTMTPDCTNVYSPSLFRLDNGNVALFFKRYMHLKEYEPIISSYFKIESADEGNTWGEEEVILDHVNFSTHNHSVSRLSDGSVIVPMCSSLGGWQAADDKHIVFVWKTDDTLKNPTESNRITAPMRGLMEPCIAETVDGTLNMVMRTQLGSVFMSQSFDMGKTWSKPQTTGLRAPESCPCIISIPDSDAQLVIWNNSEFDPDWTSHFGKRTPLTLAITRDNLKTVTDVYNLETDPTRAFTNPSVTITSDKTFVLNYWSCDYQPDGHFGGPIDLKVATFKVRV